MSIQEQDHELQTPDSFLFPPIVSDTENDVLNYNNLTISPVVKVPPWIGVNSQSKLWMHCECTYADGRGGVIVLAEAVPVGDATDASIFSCELPLDELAKLGDNTNLAIILTVSIDGAVEKQSFSSIRYNLMFQHPIALTNYSRWMTDIGTSLEHLKIRDLILPEAHNSGVDQEGAGWPADWWAACQDDTFAYQLNGGIRALDLRMYGDRSTRRFEHNGYHAHRYLSGCNIAVDRFTEQNPGEIVILDFHEVFVGDFAKDALSELLFRIRNRCIPADAHDLTIKQIRSRYPGANIVIAWDYPHPLCWKKVHQTWTGQPDNGVGQIAMHMNKIWSEPLPTGLWSMFACGYDTFSGPVRYNSSAIFWELFFSRVGSDNYRQPTRGNMINIDFFAGTGAVDKCINATRARASKAAQSAASHLYITRIGTRDVQLEWGNPAETGRLSGYNIFQNGTYLATIPSSHPRKYSIAGLADGRTYHFQVIAAFTDGIGAAAEATVVIPDVTNPSRPYDLRLLTYDFTTIASLVWEKSIDNIAVSHYEIYRDDEPTPIRTTTDLSIVVEKTSDVTYVVRAVDASGNYADSDPLIAIGDFLPPSQPGNFKATITNYNTVTLTWNPSSDNVAVDNYQIFRDQIPLGVTDSNFFSEIVNDGTYTYNVRARDASGNRSTFSDGATLKIGRPSKPTQLRAADFAGKTYIAWDGPAANVGFFYEIYRNEVPLGTVDHHSGMQSFLTENVVVPSSIVVRAWNFAGDYVDSDPVTPIGDPLPDTTAPSKPTHLRSLAVTGNSAFLEWAASSDNVAVTGYQIFRNNDPIATINNTRYTASGLTNATSYIFKVRALDAAGNFADSDPLTVKTLDTTAPSKPTDFRAYYVTHNSAILDWKAATDNVGVTRHKLFRGDEWLADIDSTDTYIRHWVMNLASGTTYVFKICAVDAAGNTGDFEYLTVHTAGSNMNPPTNLQFHRLSNQVGTIQWEPPTESGGVTGYQLSRDGQVIRELSQLSFMFTNLKGGTTYLFEVRAIRDGMYSVPASIRG
ncbi:fibronectin type III domain-containing protein [Pseudomonas silesiensis]|uniref:fibronectin type III domain-containing protein n=1 Tax=Pseudomonas silesiensis TaxID=1853130 RepID=UPI0034D72A08